MMRTTVKMIWPCDCCKRTLPVCNGDGPNERGEFTYAQCQGCADVWGGRNTPHARQSLKFISCGIEGAWRDSKDATVIEYVTEVLNACRDGFPGLAGDYLKLIKRSNHPVIMALQNAMGGRK